MDISEKISCLKKSIEENDFSSKELKIFNSFVEILDDINNEILNIGQELDEIDTDLGKIEDEFFEDTECEDCCGCDDNSCLECECDNKCDDSHENENDKGNISK